MAGAKARRPCGRDEGSRREAVVDVCGAAIFKPRREAEASKGSRSAARTAHIGSDILEMAELTRAGGIMARKRRQRTSCGYVGGCSIRVLFCGLGTFGGRYGST